MAEVLVPEMEFGPHQVMALDAELLRVLTAGDEVRMKAMLSREDDGGADNGRQQAADGQVAVDVHSAAPDCFLLGVASNGNTALHLVASRGRVELATLLCERVPSLAVTRNKCLDTPLHCAAKSGHRDMAAVLLSTMRAGGVEEESALRARNQTGATALYEAVRHGHAGVVDLLMTEAPDLSSVAIEDGFSPLYLAAMIRSSEMVRALLRSSPPKGTPSSASFSGPDGRTALHVAATVSKEIAQDILCWEPKGPSLLTRVDSSGRTPLHFAVLYRRLDIVELFLEDHYASLGLVSICDENGLSPLHIAAIVGETRTIDELVKRCPNYYELVDDKGRNLLHSAVQHGQERVVVYICQNDMFAMLLNATDSEGNTALHLAVKYAHPRIVSILLETKDVDMGITNKAGLTAADLARHARPNSHRRYFLNPHAVLYNCLRWSGAPFTLEGAHGIHVKNKLAGEEASDKHDKVKETRVITSVLIATVAFAAAFTVPGGFVADDKVRAGTAILARRFAFRAFVVSDTVAFLCSMVATCFLIYGGARKIIPRNQQRRYNHLTSGLVQVGARCMIAAFGFGFHLVLGVVNRWLIIWVYILCLASVLICFPGIWVPLNFGVGKAIWCRTGFKGFVNVHSRPSSLPHLFHLLAKSPLFKSFKRQLAALFISGMIVVAIVLSVALPNY